MRTESNKFIARNLKERLPKVCDFITANDSSKAIYAGLSGNFANYEAPAPYGAAYWSWVTDKGINTLLEQHPKLLDLTTMYYQDIIWSTLSSRPFEVFILKETFNKSCGGGGIYTRNMLLNDCAPWSPFLRELIIDTCNFILTGRRDIDITVLGNLSVDYNAKAKNGITPIFPELNVQQHFKWEDIENLTSREFFTLWVSQRRGIEDMQYAHRIMLGH